MNGVQVAAGQDVPVVQQVLGDFGLASGLDQVLRKPHGLAAIMTSCDAYVMLCEVSAARNLIPVKKVLTPHSPTASRWSRPDIRLRWRRTGAATSDALFW